jgi:hypothetical protein
MSVKIALGGVPNNINIVAGSVGLPRACCVVIYSAERNSVHTNKTSLQNVIIVITTHSQK